MTAWGPILATTDFSGPARHAVDRAAHLAHETGSTLSVMHVTPGEVLAELRRWLGTGHSSESQLAQANRQQLQQLVDAVGTARCIVAKPVQTNGSVLEEIRREGDALDAALLVVGARGAGFMRRLVLGSTSERLLRRTTRPVLVVRQTPHEPYRRVLVALDFSPWSAQAVAVAQHVAPQAHCVLFTAYEVPFGDKLRYAGVDEATIEHYRVQARADATQRVNALAAQAGLLPGRWEACVVEGEASQRIVEQEQERDCDLVVLGKHGRSATEDLLLGSVTKHVLAEGSVDVLVSTAR
ncbi:universal stress protein [Hydrogenophaga sp.]|uniref:universal stress protein n=1 Tax=Hydrogenophaga sp. TaxID=1904254 RepID=UPI0025BE1B51|nr:universal stress protein [Hydrogenophaga sp.]